MAVSHLQMENLVSSGSSKNKIIGFTAFKKPRNIFAELLHMNICDQSIYSGMGEDSDDINHGDRGIPNIYDTLDTAKDNLSFMVRRYNLVKLNRNELS